MTVGPTLTEVLGSVVKEVALYVYFGGNPDPTLSCSSSPVSNDPREGVIIAGAGCFGAPATAWVVPGPMALSAAAFPGFIFTNWVINGNIITTQSFTYNVVIPASITPVFVKAKRALSLQSAGLKPHRGSSGGQARPACQRALLGRSLLPHRLFAPAHQFPRGIRTALRGRF